MLRKYKRVLGSQKSGRLRQQNEDANFKLWVCKKNEQGKGSWGVVSPHRENKLSVRAMWSGGVIKASGAGFCFQFLKITLASLKMV